MTKIDLAAKVQKATGFTMKESAFFVESVLEIMKGTLESSESVKICGFGTFEVRSKSVRLGRNPHTGEALAISPRKVLTFRSSINLRQAMNLIPIGQLL